MQDNSLFIAVNQRDDHSLRAEYQLGKVCYAIEIGIRTRVPNVESKFKETGQREKKEE